MAEEEAQAEIQEDDEHGSKERVLLKYFLQEWKLVKSLLDSIVANGGRTDFATVRKIRSIMDKYQEQGQLVEPYLESIISPLMLIIRTEAIELGVASDQILEVIKPLCIILYSLVTVCGYKTVVTFFPHQVSDLELAVSLLEKSHHATAITSIRQESTGEMETKCVILLWLSILVLIPFDISSVDTSIVNDNDLEKLEPAPLVLRIMRYSKDYLSSAGPMRRIAGLLLSRLLTRPDMPKAFSSFIEWTHGVLSSAQDDIADCFRVLGAVEALAAIFKVGSRKVLPDVAPIMWNDISTLIKSKTAARSSLLRKFLVKLTQRIGLICLPHRSPSWHYMGRNISLGDNILMNVREKDSYNPELKCTDLQDATCLQEEEVMDIPEIIEEIIELLLSGLRDTDTIVRWSAAKGIGRITARLTAALSDEVLSSILELFSPGEGDGSWHGGCLALAELARRGLLLPVSLPKVVPVIVKALHYDIRRGPHSVGSHVRDAAAYVCWAFGRAYSHAVMRSIIKELAPHLLVVACYDREVNCRRAAAAAFQENVGRQGSFPHGIEIVNSADYFSLSSRVNSYLNVAVYIAQYREYLYPFVEELLCNKICHWDKGLRELATQALSSLAKYELGYFGDTVLGRLFPCTLSSDLCMRHGSTLAVGELVLALHQSGFMLSVEKQKSISGIVPAIEKARLYRGKGGEIMRSSVSRLIECTSISHVFLSEKIKQSLLDTLNENLKHPNAQIRGSAVEALQHFVPAYLSTTASERSNNITLKYMSLLGDPNVAARRGSALAIGILPFKFLAPMWRVVIRKLCSSCMIEDNPDDRDAEARVNSVRGIVSVCETLTNAENLCDFKIIEECRAVYEVIKNEVMHTLFKALDDYSVDNRGDVGSWVREVAMDGLQRCTYILCKRQAVNFIPEMAGVEHLSELPTGDMVLAYQREPLFDKSLATNLIGGIVKQAVEKIDKIRDMAVKILHGILYNKNIFIPSIPHRKSLGEIIPDDPGLHWNDPSFSFPRFVLLLQFTCYSRSLLSGLVVSVGGLQESLRKTSVSALLDYLQVSENECAKSSRESMLSADLLWVLHQYEKCDRVVIPTLKTIEILLSKKIFLNMEKGQTEDFTTGILDSLLVELRGSKDFSKLCTGISIFGYIASIQEPINSRAFSQLLSFLGHRYPKIRKASADQVYLVILQNGNLVADDKMEKALEIVSETCWEGDLEEAKRQRLQLYEIAGLETGALAKISIRESDKKGEKRGTSDEHESYSSLVDSAGF